jgi:hypothetical protein
LSTRERPVRARFWLESAYGLLGVVLFVVTLISREWIELIFGVDPDNGSGALELAVAFGLLAVSVGSGLIAVREWRRALTT